MGHRCEDIFQWTRHCGATPVPQRSKTFANSRDVDALRYAMRLALVLTRPGRGMAGLAGWMTARELPPPGSTAGIAVIVGLKMQRYVENEMVRDLLGEEIRKLI